MKTKTLPIRGIDYYCEIHGDGPPLLLLHGGLGSIEMFMPGLPELAKTRQVIAVELQGHGRTTLGDGPLSLASMGDDMAEILTKLDIPRADVAGYSLGGGVALRLALQHPERVRKLVVISAGFSQAGFYPEMLPMQAQLGAAAAEMMKQTPMYATYMKLSKRPEDFPRLLDRLGELMRTPSDWTEEVKQLKAHTLLVFGDSDMFRLEHVVEFYKLIGGGQRDAGWQREHQAKNRLAILPDVTHYDMFVAPQLVPPIEAFLRGNA